MAESGTTTGESGEVRRPSLRRRATKWAIGLLAAIAILVVGALTLLNTPIGERFLADRIAQETLPNGLNIRIGRIEGNLYGKAVLHDVVLSDPDGPFMTIPRAEVDWNPGAWLDNTLDIDSFAARRATLMRIPEFLPSEEEGPILPGFDIAIDRFEIERLTLSEGVLSDRAETLDLLAEVQVRDKQLKIDAKGNLGAEDRFATLIDAAPDEGIFHVALDYSAPQGGAIAGILGTEADYEARIRGEGNWERWNGGLVIRRGGERFAALRLTNRGGRFGAVGKVRPEAALEGTLSRLVAGGVAIKASVTIDDRRIDGRYIAVSDAAFVTANGLVDLAANRVGDLNVVANLRDPAGLGEGLRLEGARLSVTADGSFSKLEIDHTLSIDDLRSGSTRIAGVRQSGTATYDGTRWQVPLDAAIDRIAIGNEWLDPRLVKGRLSGAIALEGLRLSSSGMELSFPTTDARFTLGGDLATGTHTLLGDARASQLAFEDVGRAAGGARFVVTIGPDAWNVRANLDARLAPVTNATLANLAGDPIRLRGGIRAGSAVPLAFEAMRIEADKLTARLDGRITDGATTLAGSGRHSQYGPFTLEARVADSGPTATLIFADPLPAAGLRDVKVALAPTQDGFRIDTQGQSTFGPFEGVIGLAAPTGGPTRLTVESLAVSDTLVSGDLAFVDDGIAGELALTGGGLEGTVALAPRGRGQGFDIDIQARNASFGGETPIRIRRATIDAQGLIEDGNSTFSGTASGAGFSYGTLFLGRFAAQGEVTNGNGTIDASVAGRRGGSFRMDLKAGLAPQQLTLAAQGEFSGKRIRMPRRAVLARLDDGGWQLRRTRLDFGDGALVAQGRFGGGETELSLGLARMPLSLADIALQDLGLGGTISGTVDYAVGADGLPKAKARVKVDDLSRSGLVLTSRPVDLSLVADLTADELEMRAVMRNPDIRRGRMQARITGLPQSGLLIDRVRSGQLFSQLRYEGAAESLWRLAAIEGFDLTGPVAIAADATGSIADPRVRGSMRSDNLRVRSSLSGTDITNVSARGRFAGSRLRLTRFAGRTPNGGSVSGSGIVDLAGLGERIEGRFLEVRGPTLDLRASARNARLLNANGLDATITGPLRIVSNGFGGTIAGRVQIDRASWRLGTAADDMRLPRVSTREINLPADTAPRALSGRPWRYLIDAKGSSRIDVDGMGLDSEWGADIILRGTTEDPRIGGEARVVRGAYTFAGTRFELERGVIEFDANVPIDPRLDIRAETDRGGIEVVVRVTGNAQQPEIRFSSNPSLPEEEILARLLFGGSITSLSATDAIQLGAALASLRGGGGLDPINQLRSAIGLDRLRIVGADPALDRGTGVALGKNFGRRFYVELITDGRGYSATELEFRVTSWLSLLASVSTIGRESVVAEISRDY